mgnify:CR=1 FL=1
MKTSLKLPNNKFVESVQKGLNDIKLVMEEGNYKLFMKQFVAIILVFFAYRYVNGNFQSKISNIRGQISAVQAQSTNEKDYLASKQKLLDLEPRFPDLSEKNDWLLRQTVAVFRDSNITPKMGSAQAEDTTNSAYTVAALPITAMSSFSEFGHLLANIENREDYLRITEFTLKKSTEDLGQNEITLRLSTVFPQEKIASKMFKDTAGGQK